MCVCVCVCVCKHVGIRIESKEYNMKKNVEYKEKLFYLYHNWSLWNISWDLLHYKLLQAPRNY